MSYDAVLCCTRDRTYLRPVGEESVLVHHATVVVVPSDSRSRRRRRRGLLRGGAGQQVHRHCNIRTNWVAY